MSLLEHQKQHVANLEASIKKFNRALDASDTGTGKTYSTVYLCKKLGLNPLIICPKSVIPFWFNVLKEFKVNSLGVANYELIKNCRYYTGETLDKKECPYVDRKTITVKVKSGKNKGKTKDKTIYMWNIPTGTLVVFDESHKCKNSKTANSDILFSLSHQPVPILMLSATACDKPEYFKLFGYVLGLYPALSDYSTWIDEVDKGVAPMQGVNRKLFTDYASRMRIKDIPKGTFKKNSVIADCLETKNSVEIQKQYALIEQHMALLKKKEDRSQALGKIMRARMRIETLKLPIILAEAKKYSTEGNSVAIFVNFTETLLKLSEQLKTRCLVHGQQTMEERSKALKDFNSDKERVIILNLMSGGVGISLHDQNGTFPRVSIISPTWSAQDLLQALGRIHRAKAKTDATQRIIYCKGTIEEKICKNMKKKIINIGNLNDGDVESYQIEGLVETSGTSSKAPEISVFDKLFQQMAALNAKRDRLKQELAECEQEIKDTGKKLHKLIN